MCPPSWTLLIKFANLVNFTIIVVIYVHSKSFITVLNQVCIEISNQFQVKKGSKAAIHRFCKEELTNLCTNSETHKETPKKKFMFSSLLRLMRAITHAHASTCTTSLMSVRNSTRHFCLWHLLSEALKWRKWKKKLTHQI